MTAAGLAEQEAHIEMEHQDHLFLQAEPVPEPTVNHYGSQVPPEETAVILNK